MVRDTYIMCYNHILSPYETCQPNTHNDASHLTFANVSTSVLNSGVSVDVGEESQAESVGIVGGVCEAVHDDARAWGMECFPHSVVQLIIHDGTPVLRLLIGHWLQICQGEQLHFM